MRTHTDPLFFLAEPSEKLRRIRVIKDYIEQAESLRTAVVDVEDVSTGEKLEGIAITSLLPPWAAQERMALSGVTAHSLAW